jgi:methionyl-tRNA formyltransferase
LRIVFIGSPEFAIPPLEHLILNGHEIAAVYTQPDKPAGRGRQPAAPPVKKAAISWNLTVVRFQLTRPDDRWLAELNQKS